MHLELNTLGFAQVHTDWYMVRTPIPYKLGPSEKSSRHTHSVRYMDGKWSIYCWNVLKTGLVYVRPQLAADGRGLVIETWHS